MRTGITRNCEGVTRRDLLTLGTAGLLGLSLDDLLARAAHAAPTPNAQPPTPKARSLIILWLQGGPSHLETWDPKPEAPAEIRGPFGVIETNVSGVRIAEHLPRSAKVMDRLCVLRTVYGPEDSHERASRHLQTGWKSIPNVDYPSYASNFVKWKPGRGDLPPFVGLLTPSEQGFGAGFLGPQYNPFMAGDPSRADFKVRDLLATTSVPLDRIARRREILQGFDASFRAVDRKTGSFTPALERAYRMVNSPRTREAFDLQREPEALRDRYGRTPMGQACLLARRLVENGVQAVSILKGGWDTHSSNFETLKGKLLPELDPALATLVEDLSQRGLLESTVVACFGEFGRTPRINNSAGRDHWARAGSIVLAGGGFAGGRVVGETDGTASEPKSRGIRVEDFAATLYEALGIDFHQLNQTAEGRPVRIVDDGEPVREAFE